MRKVRSKRQGKKQSKPKASSVLQKFDTNHPENWLDWGAQQLYIGETTGALGTGTAAFNSALLNTSTSTPADIQPGTGITSRLGSHVVLTRLMIRGFFNLTLGARVRVIIFANPRDNLNTAGALSNTQLTAAIEASPFLRAPFKTFGGSGTLGPIDNFVDPTCDYTVLFDQMFGAGALSSSQWTSSLPITTGAGVQIGTNICPIELDMDVMLPVMYNNAGNPQTGDLFIYMCSTCPNANTGNLAQPQAYFNGAIKLQYINAVNLEAIGRTIRDFVDEAASTIEYVSKSSLVKYAASAAPYLTKIWSYLM